MRDPALRDRVFGHKGIEARRMLYGKRRAGRAGRFALRQRHIAGAGNGFERGIEPRVKADDGIFLCGRVLKTFAGCVFAALGNRLAAFGNALAQIERNRFAQRDDDASVVCKMRGQRDFAGVLRQPSGEHAHGNEIGKRFSHGFYQQIRLIFILAADIRPADGAPFGNFPDFAVGLKRAELGIRKGRVKAVVRARRCDFVARQIIQTAVRALNDRGKQGHGKRDANDGNQRARAVFHERAAR